MIALVILATRRIYLIDQRLDGRQGRVIVKPDQRPASARRRLVQPDLAIWHADRRATSGAVYLRFDVVELAGHGRSLTHPAESGEAA